MAFVMHEIERSFTATSSQRTYSSLCGIGSTLRISPNTKPTYLPLDDSADFSFFFDMSGRRICYLAPKRFYAQATNPEISAKKSKIAMEGIEGKREGKVTGTMDSFSAGCLIGELFLEGAPLFTLSQLFKYLEGEYKVDSHSAAIGVQVSTVYYRVSVFN